MNRLFSILLVLVLIACNSRTTLNNKEDTTHQNERSTKQSQEAIKVSLDTFSGLPKEIDGCSCDFYASREDKKAGKYIFVNDFAKLAFVSINGKIEKFMLKEHQEGSDSYLYFNETYYLEIKVTKEESGGDELTNEEGILTLKVEKRFIGSCGC